jgi:hypothetical protein
MIINIDIFKYSLFVFFGVIFLWVFQVGLASNLPLYIVFLIPVLLILSRKEYLLGICSFLAMSLYQALAYFVYDFEVISSVKMTFGTGLLVFCVVCIRGLALRLIQIGRLSDAFFIVFRIGATFVLLHIVIQVAFWYLGLNSFEYWGYFLPLPRFSSVFAEPSHLAIALSPYFLYSICANEMSEGREQWWGDRVLCLVIFILCPSSTLLILISLSFVIKYLYFSKSRVVGIFILVIMFLGISPFFSYIPGVSERFYDFYEIIFDGSSVDVTMNASTLLFVKGLQSAQFSLENYPLGVGAFNMAFSSEQTDVSLLNYFYETENSEDGTSILFKLIAEFGIVGILLAIYAFYKFHKCMKVGGEAYLMACLLAAFFASCLRGTSYFDGVVIISFALIFINTYGKCSYGKYD